MSGDLKKISDGKLYKTGDMVKVGCHDCEGCSRCCCDMGQSILLDPLDVFRLTKQLKLSFEQLLEGPVELHVEGGLILPNLKMRKDALTCYFLNGEGRCSIHSFRPGICRLFPLGRNYEGERLDYFLLRDVCPAKNKSKMKIAKWLDMPDLKEYERFLIKWHAFTKEIRRRISHNADDEAGTRRWNMAFLQLFYLQPYESENFYEEFYHRMDCWKW